MNYLGKNWLSALHPANILYKIRSKFESIEVIKKYNEKRKIMRNKQEFRDTMYDYNNINEYLSFYGDVIYVSSDFFDGRDYFTILKKDEKYALVEVSASDLTHFNSFLNRDDLLDTLDGLQSRIQWVEGYNNFKIHMRHKLDTCFFHPASQAELIKIKDNELALWNYLIVEMLIKRNQKYKTPHTREMVQHMREVRPNLYISTVNVVNAFNTQFSLIVEWVQGNPFLDITVMHFNTKLQRKLNIFDIAEFNDVLSVMSYNNDFNTVQRLSEFKI